MIMMISFYTDICNPLRIHLFLRNEGTLCSETNVIMNVKKKNGPLFQ